MSEKAIQHAVKRALAMFGVVSDLSQPRASMQTPGLPDLYFQSPSLMSRGLAAWFEVKRPGAKLSDAQRLWHARERASGGKVAVVRSAQDAMWALKAWGVPVEPSGEPSEEIAEQFPELRAGPVRHT